MPELKVKESEPNYYTWGTRSDPSALLHPMLDHLHITLKCCKFTEVLEPRAGGKMEAVAPAEDRE